MGDVVYLFPNGEKLERIRRSLEMINRLMEEAKNVKSESKEDTDLST